ncbi:hypothetical protein J6590_070849 [Homalodisca vitripennis]|nr:hypothetical protein J6590_070849 [Homalodisca vitripennis]
MPPSKKGKEVLGRIIADELLSTSTLRDDVSASSTGAATALTDTTMMPSVDAAVLNERDISTDTPTALMDITTSTTVDAAVLNERDISTDTPTALMDITTSPTVDAAVLNERDIN